MNRAFVQTAVVLGLLSAIGPFAIDMYLPALPSIGQSLGTSVPAVQASLMAFFIAMGLGQVVYGPASDMLGRKLPLYFGVVLFGIASVACARAPDIENLIAWRFVQGLGACAAMVVPRAVVRDLHTGVEAARLMALLMLVFSVSPVLAPLIGSLLIESFGWRSVFWAVTAIAVGLLVLLTFALPETRPPKERVQSNLRGALAAYSVLLRDRHFLGLVLIGAFGSAAFFAYLANSPFVMINHYGLTPREYGMAFGINAASFIGVSQLTARLTGRFGLVPVLRAAVLGFTVFMVLLAALDLLGVARLDLLIVLMLIGFGFLGLVFPSSAVLAMDPHGPIAGTASALMGTLQFMVGAGVMALLGQFAGNSARPMVLGVAACALAALLTTWATLGRHGDAAADNPKASA